MHVLPTIITLDKADLVRSARQWQLASPLFEFVPETTLEAGTASNQCIDKIIEHDRCLHAHTVHSDSTQQPVGSPGASCVLHAHGWAPA
jgi:hypothetical protein